MTADARPQWETVQARVFLAARVGLFLCVVGVLIDRQQFYRSYLTAFLFWLGVGVGGLVLLMLQFVTGGAWGLLLRRLLEAATRTLPLLALFFVPLAFSLFDEPYGPYIWANHDLVEHDPHLLHKQPYLNAPFFLLRAALYFGLWLTLAYFLNRWSAEQDATGDPRLARRFRLVSAPGMGLHGLVITFASIDWAMSLEPHWYSTMYGLLFAAGQVLTAYTFALLMMTWLADRPPLDALAGPEVRRDLGNLLLALVMFWTYLSLSQYLLIWAGNLPEETPWYLRRQAGGWDFLPQLLIAFHFAVPFVLLLSRQVKTNPRHLAAVAGLVFLMRYVDLYWYIMPAFQEPRDSRLTVHWMDLATMLGVGGLWLSLFLRQLAQRPLVPAHDPRLAEATHHG